MRESVHEERSMGNTYVIRSASRTLQVLLSFGKPPHRYSLADLQREARFEKNQLYRSLKTLEAAGYLGMDEDGRFYLTGVVNGLVAAASDTRTRSLVGVAAAHLDALAQASGEHVNLFVLAGDHAVCVDQRESAHLVRIGSMVGRSIALFEGAAPKAMLAFLDPGRCEEALTDLGGASAPPRPTTLDPDGLRAELAAARERGYTVDDGYYDVSARGVGAPIFDVMGNVVAGVSTGGPSFRVARDDLPRLGALVVEAARAISLGLGEGSDASEEGFGEL
jgi:DNA-binding IclR family transcriptional regulator